MVQAVVVIAVAAGFAAILLGRQGLAWRRFRGRRAIVCPENQSPAGVVVDARHAAARSLLGAPELRLASCSRWPEKAACGQPCLSQIAASPEDCLVRNIVSRWYQGKACVFCGRPFGAIDWTAAQPALLPANGVAVEWSQVPAEELSATMAASQPVCPACHLANKMVREHPDLVADRSAAANVASRN
jgi:hypothetical protein